MLDILSVIIYIILIFSVIVTYTNKYKKHENIKQSYNYLKHLKPFSQKNNSSQIYQNKIQKKPFFDSLFNKEIDCELDERIFGPKNQKKDLF